MSNEQEKCSCNCGKCGHKGGWTGSLSLFLLVASVVAAIWGWSVYKETSKAPAMFTITASSEAKETVKPDLAKIVFSVVTQGADPKSVQKINDGKMGSVVSFLKDSGIKEEDLKTVAYELSPRYDYTWCREEKIDVYCSPKIIGYTLTQRLEIKVKNISSVGDVVGGLSEKGANEIISINFTVENPDIAKAKARQEAINKAKEKALTMAKASGVKLGRLVGVYEDAPYVTPYPAYRDEISAKYNAGAAISASPIQIGSTEITSNISLVYEIKN